MALLSVENIKKSFGSSRVLDSISFTLEKGEALAIIGSSGSGKTTLLRCLNFLELPEEGKICVNGETLFDGAAPGRPSDAEIREKRLRFGLVFQGFNLFPQYNAMENIALAEKLRAKELLKKRGEYKGCASYKEACTQIEAHAAALLEGVGLAEKAKSYPFELSGGQKQRVAIARAMAMEPEILCFDEPTSALDPELTGEVLKVIKSLKNADTTMIIVTHEIAFARDIADRVIFMSDGAIAEQGTPAELIESPKNPRTREFLARFFE